MARLVIEPVRRIEGHARVSVQLGDDGQVLDARVQVTELRGFERIVVGRPVGELPALTARICGICPVSHALAAALAGDQLLGAPPPPAARKLRLLLQLGQLVSSHATSFFYLSGPDLALGPGMGPERGSILGLAAERPALAADGVALRRFGQEAVAAVAGQRIHAPYAVPGGVARPLAPAVRDAVAAALPAALQAAERVLAWWCEEEPAHAALARATELPGLFLALTGEGGRLSLGEGRLRLLSASGAPLLDGADPSGYAALLGEAQEPDSYPRFPFYRPLGYPAGLYRVGPLARLNAASRCGTPRADRALSAFRVLSAGPVRSTFHAHRARLVELLHALERMEELLQDPLLLDAEVRSPQGARGGEAVGACEAPRGTLFHHYRADAQGLVTWANLVVATGQNTLAMNQAVRQVAERWLSGGRITEALLARVEAAIRAFDPCLSCATHALSGPAVRLRLLGPGGELLDEVPRGEG